MIGILPKSLEVNGKEHPINSDFRAALLVFEAFGDAELTQRNKMMTMLEIVYGEMIPSDTEEAMKQAVWFLDIGMEVKKQEDIRTMDYKQDEQYIFSAVNAVYTKDVRELDYMHWWTFYGLCQAISPESLISHISSIRYKKAKNKKLDKHEQEFYRNNRHLIDFRTSDDDYDVMVRQLRG